MRLALWGAFLVWLACSDSDQVVQRPTLPEQGRRRVQPRVSGVQTPTGTVHMIEVRAGGRRYRFLPASLTIKQGDTVRWVAYDSPPHNVAFFHDRDLGGHYPAARDATPLPFRAAATTVVDAIAEDRDVMLLLDDAHLAPHPVVDLLKAVAQRCQARPLCLVLTVRISAEGSSVEALEARIGREVPGEVLSTLDLSQGDIEDLIRWALPQYDESDRARLVRRPIADTGGNPFLAVELLLAVRGGLELPAESTDPTWLAADRTLDQTLPTDLPAAVSAGLRLRYRMLSDGAQQALLAAAVLGAPASAETVALASGLGRKEVETALDELEWERWLVGDTRGYDFVTRLAQQVILREMVTAGQKRRLLLRAGRGSG